ncbi:hypothetical protein ACFV98_02670 [Streptomyces violascens]|uniref:hypothetical protein n=1 Tax=Streptomyces violascens TaxID=67381 RepID=UPI003652559A
MKGTDANGRSASSEYDAAGRLTKGWRSGRATTTTPNATIVYDLSSTARPVMSPTSGTTRTTALPRTTSATATTGPSASPKPGPPPTPAPPSPPTAPALHHWAPSGGRSGGY